MTQDRPEKQTLSNKLLRKVCMCVFADTRGHS